jgi:Xaa-Pro aminopeptidase
MSETANRFQLSKIQESIRLAGLDGWLLYDFRGSNPLARRVLGFSSDKFLSRRWFYFIPASGEPQQLVHRIEPNALSHLPGRRQVYLRWQELENGVQQLISGCRQIAMEYVPRNANPYISRVDAGTVELVRSAGVDIVSSGDLIQRFEAVWDDDQWAMHLEAAQHVREALETSFRFIREKILHNGSVHELEVQKVIVDYYSAHGLFTDHGPIVARGPHSGDPHYEPQPGDHGMIRRADFVLIDLWAKLKKPRAVYSDLTWTCFVGDCVPENFTTIFNIVAAARDAAIQRVRDAFSRHENLQGWQVDHAARSVIESAGYGEFFCHRTGHSIGEETHGNGANMDSLETREERQVLPGTCFSIEPGIYLPEFGVRSETNVFVDRQGVVHVTGGELQSAIVPLLA